MTAPARVALVTSFYHPVVGGAESAAGRLAGYLQRRGHAVVVITKRTAPEHAPDAVEDGVRVIRVGPIGPRRGSGKWRAIPGVFRALRRLRGQFDVVCCIDYRGVGLAALAASRVPVIFQAQTEGVLSGGRLRWLARILYRRADAFACISRAIERETLDAGVPPAHVHYIPNPIDSRVFHPATDAEKQAARVRLGLPMDAVIVTFAGRLSREKGVIELLEAWARLTTERGLLLVIGPSAPGHPWDVSAQAARFVDEHALATRVRFMGVLPLEDLAEGLRASDVGVLPSYFESFGIAAVEAMATGLAVVSSDTGGPRDFITPGTNGLLVPARDVAALAGALDRVCQDAPLRASLGRAARETALQFDEAVVLERFAQLVDTLAGRP